MSAVAETMTETGTDIVATVERDPSLVLVDETKLDAFYEAMAEKVRAHKPDLSTDKGRKAIASLAHEVSKRKVEVDKAGLRLTEDWRKQIGKVNEARRSMSARFDALRDEARQPLTDWETAEEVRKNARERDMAELADLAAITPSTTADEIRERIAQLEAMEITKETHQEYAEPAGARRDNALHTLRSELVRAEQAEADRRELEALREQRRLQEEKEAAEAEERQREAERIERERQEAEAAEAERQRQARAAEAERMRQEEAAERAREEERRRLQLEHEAELQRIQDEHDAEARRREDEENARIENERKEREAAEARAADIAHRSEVMKAAKVAIMDAGEIDEAKAKAVVQAIVAGLVPNVAIRF
ncbi:hypothetical protein DYI37_04010 [Fulvimarina endophytica]|uniref:DUF1351 domain-containing protein n=1 Tax=Fulvimarina endophytica TaxID=2293836 RepID=A0A371X721_9HYPH|nr:hypothetical protein [Fulvimarina endophytica]RFC65039.1 hypothetical protein DYI37_04010 [Fulvimarina endophytica]